MDKKLLDSFDEIYNYFCETGYNFGLVEAFDFLLLNKKNEKFGGFVSKLVELRGDLITSDIECATAYFLYRILGLEKSN